MKAILVMMLIAIIMAGCAQQPTENIVEDRNAPIKIGVLVPLSGEGVSLGDGAMAGVDVAVKEINDAGGINGRKIEVIYEDDKCSNAGATAINKLINVDGVDAIIGPVCSASAGPAVPVAEAAGVPVIIIGASAPGLADGDYIFRVYPSDTYQGKFQAEYAYNIMEKKNAVIVYTINDYGVGLSNSFEKRFKELGGNVVFKEGVNQKDSDFRSLMIKIKDSNADVIISSMYPANIVSFTKEAKESGITLPVFGTDIFYTDEVLNSDSTEGALYTLVKVDVTDELIQKAAKINRNANFVSPFAYDCVMVYADAVKKAGTNKADVKEMLKNTKFDGLSNNIEFDDKGDIKEASYEVLRIENHKPIEVS